MVAFIVWEHLIFSPVEGMWTKPHRSLIEIDIDARSLKMEEKRKTDGDETMVLDLKSSFTYRSHRQGRRRRSTRARRPARS